MTTAAEKYKDRQRRMALLAAGHMEASRRREEKRERRRYARMDPAEVERRAWEDHAAWKQGRAMTWAVKRFFAKAVAAGLNRAVLAKGKEVPRAVRILAMDRAQERRAAQIVIQNEKVKREAEKRRKREEGKNAATPAEQPGPAPSGGGEASGSPA